MTTVEQFVYDPFSQEAMRDPLPIDEALRSAIPSTTPNATTQARRARFFGP
jgi:hypothetical protein